MVNLQKHPSFSEKKNIWFETNIITQYVLKKSNLQCFKQSTVSTGEKVQRVKAVAPPSVDLPTSESCRRHPRRLEEPPEGLGDL